MGWEASKEEPETDSTNAQLTSDKGAKELDGRRIAFKQMLLEEDSQWKNWLCLNFQILHKKAKLQGIYAQT